MRILRWRNTFHTLNAFDAVMRVNTGGFVTCAKHAFRLHLRPDDQRRGGVTFRP
jgi:hypothetical protein